MDYEQLVAVLAGGIRTVVEAIADPQVMQATTTVNTDTGAVTIAGCRNAIEPKVILAVMVGASGLRSTVGNTLKRQLKPHVNDVYGFFMRHADGESLISFTLILP